MKQYILSLCALILIVATSATVPVKYKRYIANYENVLGTSLEITVHATSATVAGSAEDAILKEIDRLDQILSTYKPNSEFSRWNRSAGAIKVSKELFEVLEMYDRWMQRTNKALNPAAAAIGKVWKNAEGSNRLPDAQALENAVRAANNKHWVLNAATRTAQRIGNTPLVLNSFVKSYIINKAASAAIEEKGITGVVVNIGGDLVLKGAMSERIQVSDPMADAENDLPLTAIKVVDGAVATSGNYRRGYNVAGKWYSHILDPRTGQPSANIISATVVAEDAATAGALATAFNVLSIVERKKLAASYPQVAYMLVDKDGKIETNGQWDAIAEPTAEIMPEIGSSVAQQFNTNYELLVNLELALVTGQRIYRPFVAIWIEDANNKPIRNLVVWFNKPRWLPDLKNWYRAYGLDFNAEGNPVKATSSATRSPGKYTVKWDGKDDKGVLVKAGTYKVNIEVVREHGTYQLLSDELNFNGKPNLINLQKNVEVASASLDYRKKSK